MQDSQHLPTRTLPESLGQNVSGHTPSLKEQESLILPADQDGWSIDSWRSKHAAQAVEYEDPESLEMPCETLRMLPPLVTTAQIESARRDLEEVAIGKAFMMQGGDCAESFDDVKADIIFSKVSLLEQQARILTNGLCVRVVKMGRIAGQYAKPRSCPYETLPDGSQVHAFRGHNVNGPGVHERKPDPQRLLLGYFYAKMTLNYLHVMEQIPVDSALGVSASSAGVNPSETQAAEPSLTRGAVSKLHTAKEALHLPFESAVTKGRYNTSVCFIWIGERTRQLDSAHVEYMRGLRNPIGIKLGPRTDPTDLINLLDTLSPSKRESGRITLITRLGASNVEAVLPSLITAVRLSGHNVIWVCDPCHGNTVTTSTGLKTRRVQTIIDELTRTHSVHCRLGSRLCGLHLEQTGEDVTECLDKTPVLGGGYEEDELLLNYKSLCDPRLSRAQALKVVQEFVNFVLAEGKADPVSDSSFI